jgi:hypothetical protein
LGPPRSLQLAKFDDFYSYSEGCPLKRRSQRATNGEMIEHLLPLPSFPLRASPALLRPAAAGATKALSPRAAREQPARTRRGREGGGPERASFPRPPRSIDAAARERGGPGAGSSRSARRLPHGRTTPGGAASHPSPVIVPGQSPTLDLGGRGRRAVVGGAGASWSRGAAAACRRPPSRARCSRGPPSSVPARAGRTGLAETRFRGATRASVSGSAAGWPVRRRRRGLCRRPPRTARSPAPPRDGGLRGTGLCSPRPGTRPTGPGPGALPRTLRAGRGRRGATATTKSTARVPANDETMRRVPQDGGKAGPDGDSPRSRHTSGARTTAIAPLPAPPAAGCCPPGGRGLPVRPESDRGPQGGTDAATRARTGDGAPGRRGPGAGRGTPGRREAGAGGAASDARAREAPALPPAPAGPPAGIRGRCLRQASRGGGRAEARPRQGGAAAPRSKKGPRGQESRERPEISRPGIAPEAAALATGFPQGAPRRRRRPSRRATERRRRNRGSGLEAREETPLSLSRARYSILPRGFRAPRAGAAPG